MMKSGSLRVLSIVAAFFVSWARAEDARTFVALLETGGSWNLVAPSVVHVFTDEHFRALLPTNVVCELNTDLKAPFRSVRYPALFLRDAEGRVILREENLSQCSTAAALGERISSALAAYDKACADWTAAQDTRLTSFARAELYGRAFAELDPYVSGITARWLLREQDTSRGACSFAERWRELKKLDPRDATGWQARFTLGNGYEEVRRADMASKNGGLARGLAVAAEFRARAKDFWTPQQRQAVEMAEFAAYRRAQANLPRQAELLHKVLAIAAEAPEAAGESTIWSAAATGYLQLMENAEAKVTIAPLSVELPTEFGVDKIRAQLATNEIWRQEFDGAGPVRNRELAVTNLAVFVAGGGERLMDSIPLRRLAMATALNCLKRPLGQQLAMILAYRRILERGRINAEAIGQSVYDWRLVVANGHDAGELEFASKLVNCSREQLQDAHSLVPYNMYNCFGEFSHCGEYYRPWFLCGWTPAQAAIEVGGVCVAQSSLAVLLYAAHGLAAVTCSQPGHCAFAADDGQGHWKICNRIGSGTSPKFKIGEFYLFMSLDLQSLLYSKEVEQTYASDRLVAEGDFESATRLAPRNFRGWSEWWKVLKDRRADAAAKRDWAERAARALADTREYFWLVLNPYVEDLAAKSPSEAAEQAVWFYGQYRLDRMVPDEESLLDIALQRQRRIFKRHPEEMLKIYRAALKVAAENRRMFEGVLKSGETFVKEYPAMTEAFQAAVRAVNRQGLDYSVLIRSASRNRNLNAFREAVRLQDAAKPPKSSGTLFPVECLGGRLISAEGMITTSSQHPKLDFPANYARSLDATPSMRSYAPFYTKAEQEAWALVTLPEAAELTAIRLDNDFLASNRSRQLPLEVLVSADGEAWTSVARFERPEREYLVDLSVERPSARYVKVVRGVEADGKKRPFALRKILVYGCAK